MSKDLVRLLKLQEIGRSTPRPSHGGIDESFNVIRRELDALASKAGVVSESVEGLERKEALQALELRALRRALHEREGTRRKLESQVSSLRAQLNRGLDTTDESVRGEARVIPVGTPEPIAVYDFSPSPETGFPANLNIKNVPVEWKQEGTDWFAVFNPKVKRTLDITLTQTFNYNSPVKCVRLSPDMNYLASACGTTVHICNAKTGVEICTFPTNKPVTIISFSPDSGFLAVGSHDEKLHIWEIPTREIRYIFGGNTSGTASLCFSSDGRFLMAGSYYNTVRIWFFEDGSCQTIRASSQSILSIVASPKRLLVLGCRNGSVEIWKTKKGRNAKKGKEPKQGQAKLIETIQGHESAVNHLAFTRGTGDGLLTAGGDNKLKYWDATLLLSGKKKLKKHKEAAGGRPLLRCVRRFAGHKECVTSLAVSPDNKWVVSGSKDHSVQFWDIETETLQCMLKGHTNVITSVDLSQTGNVLVTGSNDGLLRMWAYTKYQKSG